MWLVTFSLMQAVVFCATYLGIIYICYFLRGILGGSENGPLVDFVGRCAWNLPVCFIRIRANAVRKHVLTRYRSQWPQGAYGGRTRLWDFRDIRRHKLYEACARDVYGETIRGFWFGALIMGLVAFLLMKICVAVGFIH